MKAYIDKIYAEGCFCLIDKPTRITTHSATSIDHFYTNITNKPLTSSILLFDISDHFPISCSIEIKPIIASCSNNQMFRSTTNFNKDAFAEDIYNLTNLLTQKQDCTGADHSTDTQIDEVCSTFIIEFSNIVNFHAPMKKMNKKKK